MSSFRIVSILLIMLAIQSSVWAQSTRIRGTIRDKATQETIPYASVNFTGSTIGTISDLNGEFILETTLPYDTILVSFVGFKSVKLPITRYILQSINVEMEENVSEISDVEVMADRYPANKIVRKIIANKDNNNPSKIESYQFEGYNKIEFDLTNVDQSMQKSGILKQFDFVFDHIDTSIVTGKLYVPIFISESLSDFYYQKTPQKRKEIIKATKVSGIENPSFTQLTGQMYQDVNIYDNYISVFGKNFVSPIADFGLSYYQYFLIDSLYIDGQYCYQIAFKPKRKQEPTFTGEFMVHDTTSAIRWIKARIAEDANLNYVNDLVVRQDFRMINDSVWFLEKDDMFVDFNLTDKSTGFFGRKLTMSKNIKVNQPFADDFFSKKTNQDIITADDADEKDDQYWLDNRHKTLTAKETQIYQTVDSIKQVPVFKITEKLTQMVANGYYITKYIEWGPYYTAYSFNEVEGTRLKLGGRTSNDFSKKLMLETYVAYGLRDKQWKYQLGGIYVFNKNPRKSAGLSYSYDVEQLGQSDNAFMEDNILSTLLKRRPLYKLSPVSEYKAFYQHEWFQGFSNTLTIKHRTLYPTQYVPFEQLVNQRSFDEIRSFEVKLNTRFAYNEKFLYGEFLRTSLGTNYPILNLDIIKGFKGVAQSDYPYFKVKASIEHDVSINPIGTFSYLIQAGKLWGTLPYPLLTLHEGNETYAFDPYAFNLMNYYEFVSDEYISLYAEHHFEGFFLDHIPLVRKLKWREIIYAKALAGSLNPVHTTVLDFSQEMTSLSGNSYYEAGFGFENIFKLFRVDAMWRLSDTNKPDVQKFAILASMQVIF